MKNLKILFAVLFLMGIFFTSCKKDENTTKTENIVPANFKVDIPSSISQKSFNKGGDDNDTLQGGEIYEHLTNFIAVGENAADIVQEIMGAISKYGLNKAMTFSFDGDDDEKTKNVVIVENSDFEGVTWEYQLTITDAGSESDTDQGIGMQVFWNRSPVKGIAILAPENINTADTDAWAQAMFRIDYSEAGENSYEKQMTVYISDLPIPTSNAPYGMATLKMFAGKTGEIVDVYGNSNHPAALFFNAGNSGFNWAFVASGNETKNIGVAEVGLPASNLDTDSRTKILKDNSIYNVFNTLIKEAYPEATDSIIAPYLKNTNAPGYFKSSGFMSAGVSPSTDYEILEANIENLTPYNPIQISNLKVEFKKLENASK